MREIIRKNRLIIGIFHKKTCISTKRADSTFFLQLLQTWRGSNLVSVSGPTNPSNATAVEMWLIWNIHVLQMNSKIQNIYVFFNFRFCNTISKLYCSIIIFVVFLTLSDSVHVSLNIFFCSNLCKNRPIPYRCLSLCLSFCHIKFLSHSQYVICWLFTTLYSIPMFRCLECSQLTPFGTHKFYLCQAEVIWH